VIVRGWVLGHHACSEQPILLLELSNTALEVRELGLAAVPRVLGGDTVAVGTSLPALLGRDVGARALAGGRGGGGIVGGFQAESREMEGG
jgi:hypothetical protein